MKRLSADDSAGSRVKVGHRQAPHRQPQKAQPARLGFLLEGSLPASGRCNAMEKRQLTDCALFTLHAFGEAPHFFSSEAGT